MAWEELRDPSTNHMVGRFDAERLLLEVKRKGAISFIDLLPFLQRNGIQVIMGEQRASQPAVERQEQSQDSK